MWFYVLARFLQRSTPNTPFIWVACVHPRKQFSSYFLPQTDTDAPFFLAPTFLCLISYYAMAKLPTMFSLRHFLVLSLALNVSLLLRLMMHQGAQKAHKERTNSVTEEHHNIHKSRMVISSSSSSSSTSSFANSTSTTGASSNNRVINLDQ